MTTVLTHEPISTDLPDIRPTLAGAVSTTARLGLAVGAAVAGAGAATLAAPTAATALTAAVVGAGLVTSLAANWSTCGMSVAGVVAAPKQPGRKGASTPVRRLGWHALGSVTTGAVTGAALGALGSVTAANLSPLWLLFGWAVFALAYGLHEIGVVSMPAPMRRQQLPRHLRRTMAPWKVSLLFGAIIGPGFLIFIRSSAYYLLVLGVLVLVRRVGMGMGDLAVSVLVGMRPVVLVLAHRPPPVGQPEP